MRLGAGPGKTRGDHLEIAAQLYALVAEARRISDLAEVVGADALSESELAYLRFVGSFEADFVHQGTEEERELADTLDRAWRVASVLPRRELTMVSGDAVAAHYVEDADADQGSAG
jgi:V/A-type H+-transporting ATPase subunit B